MTFTPVSYTHLAYITEFERIGDYAINVVERSGEMFDKELSFSDSAKYELNVLDGAIKEIISLAEKSFRHNDAQLAASVEPVSYTHLPEGNHGLHYRPCAVYNCGVMPSADGKRNGLF